MMAFDDIVAISKDWPEVSASTWYGTPGLLVRKKGFCRLWGEREHARDDVHDTEVLVVLCELEVKAALLDSHPDVLFSTPHYDGHGAMLVRLSDVERDDLAEWLEESYRLKAPATLVRQLDALT